jgi:hypothetical protein
MEVDVVRAESARFRHPLLLVHGLWTGSWIWGGLAAYLAHRGWDSWAPSFDGRGADGASARLRQLLELARILPAPPVVVAHDASVVLATKLATSVGAPAIIAITPLLARLDGGDLGTFAHPQFWPARCFARQVRPPRGRAARLLLAGLGDHAARLRSDSGPFFRSVCSGAERLPDVVPRSGLLVAAPGDPLLPGIERLAHRLDWSADLHQAPGHFPMTAPGWEQLAGRLHRWLVRTIGEDLLLLAADEPDPE